MKHDEHYKEGIQAIDIMEQRLCVGIPEGYHADILRNFRIAMALKYLVRCGKKDGSEKELDKAINYLHRAKTGEWIND